MKLLFPELEIMEKTRLLLNSLGNISYLQKRDNVAICDELSRLKTTIKNVPFVLKGHGVSSAYLNIMALFDGLFLEELLPQFSVIRDQFEARERFSLVEDRLLLVGLKRYGFGNWEIIRAKFLPTRTSNQLALRYKNLNSRRAPDNPIKVSGGNFQFLILEFSFI